MKSLLTIAIVVAGIVFGQVTGKETICMSIDSCSLKGRPSVLVAVDCSKDVRKAGVSWQQLTTEVELLLRKFGVPVGTDLNDNDITLYINTAGYEITSASGEGTGKYYYVVRFEAGQCVRLDRNPSIRVVGAITWQVPTTVGYLPAGSKGIKDTLTDITTDNTKRFINAYLEANPK